MKSHIHWHLMIQWRYPRWRMTPLPFCQSVVFTKSRAPFPAFHSHFCLEAATDGLTTRHCGSFLLWVLLAKGIAIDMYTLGKATYLVHPAWNPTPQVTVWVWLSSSISPPVFLPGVRQKQLSQVTLEKLSGNPVTWSSPVSGEDGRKGLVRVTFWSEEFGFLMCFRYRHLGWPDLGRPTRFRELSEVGIWGSFIFLFQEAVNPGPPEQWDWGQEGMSRNLSAFSHEASKEIPLYCIYKASPTVSFLEHNVFNKKPLSLVKLSET